LVAGYGRAVIGPISLDVRAGEVVGIWGANGCGKTTLLNAIADRADVLDGRIERAPGLILAYQEQQPVRLPAMPITGHELLRYADASPDGMPSALRDGLGQRIDRLSGGQYQLLCVWAAMVGPANLILLDEPTNNLDPERETLLSDMLAPRRLARRGEAQDRAVLLVSHERGFLDNACSRVIEIR
jgi:zinc transport system ATP-binding protein